MPISFRNSERQKTAVSTLQQSVFVAQLAIYVAQSVAQGFWIGLACHKAAICLRRTHATSTRGMAGLRGG